MVTGSALIDGPSVAGGPGSIYDAMGGLYSADWNVLEAGAEGYCPASGCAISASGTAGKVDISAGIASFGNVDVSVPAATAIGPTVATLLTNASASAGQAMWCGIEVDSSGTPQQNPGSAATVTTTGGPLKPPPTAGRVVVAYLYIVFGATVVDALLTNNNGNAKIVEARRFTPMQPPHITAAYIESGCVWSGDALGSTKAASMTAGVVWIAGVRLRVPAVTSRTFTASKDTYVDFQNNSDGTASITYTEVSNNAASPALPSSGTVLNTIRNAIIVTGASNIASATVTDGSVNAINMGSPFNTLPIASSVPYCVTDSLGVPIYPVEPASKLIGYRQAITSQATTTTPTKVDLTGLSAPFIIPAGRARRVKVTVWANSFDSTEIAGANIQFYIVNGSTVIGNCAVTLPVSTYGVHIDGASYAFLAPGSYTFKAQMSQSAAGTLTMRADPTYPAYISIELV